MSKLLYQCFEYSGGLNAPNAHPPWLRACWSQCYVHDPFTGLFYVPFKHCLCRARALTHINFRRFAHKKTKCTNGLECWYAKIYICFQQKHTFCFISRTDKRFWASDFCRLGKTPFRTRLM